MTVSLEGIGSAIDALRRLSEMFTPPIFAASIMGNERQGVELFGGADGWRRTLTSRTLGTGTTQ
jgi:hypothetical protein